MISTSYISRLCIDNAYAHTCTYLQNVCKDTDVKGLECVSWKTMGTMSASNKSIWWCRKQFSRVYFATQCPSANVYSLSLSLIHTECTCTQCPSKVYCEHALKVLTVIQTCGMSEMKVTIPLVGYHPLEYYLIQRTRLGVVFSFFHWSES